MKKFILILIAVVLISALSLFSFSFFKNELISWSKTTVSVKDKSLIKLSRGISLENLAQLLESQKLIDSKFKFKIWVKYFSDFRKFKAGLYLFEDKVSPKSIAENFILGKIHTPLALKFTIKEGSSVKDVCKVIEEKKIEEFSECLSYLLNKDNLKNFELKGESFEGYLYPATYFFYKKPKLLDAVSQMITNFKKNIDQSLIEKLNSKKLSLYESLIFASLIEKEVSDYSEYEKVSEVIWNRLNKNIGLGIDAALIYGIKDYNGDIKFSHLRDKSNPYNTRIHRGLPPTPICSPTRKALEAILNPTDKGYFYYVHDIEKGNLHHFSKTLKEHNKYVRKLKSYTR